MKTYTHNLTPIDTTKYEALSKEIFILDTLIIVFSGLAIGILMATFI